MRPTTKKERGGKWERQARAVIADVAARCKAEGHGLVATLAAIDAAYPFGQRKYWPYAAWLKARRAWLHGVQSPTPDEEKLRAWEAGEKIPGGAWEGFGDAPS